MRNMFHITTIMALQSYLPLVFLFCRELRTCYMNSASVCSGASIEVSSVPLRVGRELHAESSLELFPFDKNWIHKLIAIKQLKQIYGLKVRTRTKETSYIFVRPIMQTVIEWLNAEI